MSNYLVKVEDSVEYSIEAPSEREAIELAWEWFDERRPRFKVVRYEPSQGQVKWPIVAKMIDPSFMTDPDFEDDYFICPMCQEPIYEEDFPNISVKIDTNLKAHPYCPICRCPFEE